MMVEFYEENGREIIPVMFESSYEELKESFETKGYWDDLGLDEETYSDSNLAIDFEFMTYHENPLTGEINMRIYGEDVGDYEEIHLSDVKTSDVLRILGEGQEEVEGNLAEASMNGAEKVEAD